MEPLTGLIVYGPLGLWALAATGAVAHLYRESSRLRDAHVAKVEAMGKEHTATMTTAAVAFTTLVNTLGATHAQTVREQADRYDRQIGEMQQRTFGIVTSLSDKMSALADSITRHRGP